MSQEGILSATSSSPTIPTAFAANVGSAVPALNVLNIFGVLTAAGSTPINTTGSGNTIDVNVQKSQAIPATNANNVGLAAFNSTEFTVDGNGFVSLIGGPASVKFTVDTRSGTGTNPVLPDGTGNITITGSQVVAGTTSNAIRIDSLSANSYTIQIQRSQAVGLSTIADNGISHFNSAQFTVDGNGFVGLVGSGANPPILGVHPNATSGGGTDPTVCDASGNISILGATVAAGTNPIRSVATAAHSMTMQAQISQAIAATDATKIGLANFDSARFSVDANGFVTVNGAGIGETITGNSGGALSPTAGNWNIVGASAAAGAVPVTTAGSVSTLTVKVQTSQAIASTDATKIGLSAFDSADFTVDANGFVTAIATTLNYTNVNHAASPYTVLSTDEYISVDCSAGTVTLNFPNAPTFKRAWIIKDRTGNAATNNISITTPGGTVTFDGATTYKIISNYGAINLLANATPTYEVY